MVSGATMSSSPFSQLVNNVVNVYRCRAVKCTATHLPFVQRADHRAVVELGLANHSLGELHLGRDVGHRYGVVVVVGDVQSALDG